MDWPATHVHPRFSAQPAAGSLGDVIQGVNPGQLILIDLELTSKASAIRHIAAELQDAGDCKVAE